MLENDYFLNSLYNPNFNSLDFKEIGLNTQNTSIENLDKYKELDVVKNNPLLQTDGVFDEAKLEKFYLNTLKSYNSFANEETVEQIKKEDFFRDDIYASYDEKLHLEESFIRREANPLKKKRGLIHTNDVIESPYSIREIAQTLKVWDSTTESWLDAPNDSFFGNFGETRVLAQWDEDGTHIDPFTGLEVLHVKGEKKINENGTYYYENLNGRDIYGRDVLSKFDTLTTDGSFMNKFDFFDGDDKDSNIYKNIIRNVVKVVPAFIPGVNTWYLGARVGLNTVDLLAKIGKIIAGSNSPNLNAIEGFANQFTFSTSDYSRGSQEANIAPHAWSLENMLNLGADTFTQLAEQRWLFKYAPSLFKGKAGRDKDAALKLQESYGTQFGKDSVSDITKVAKNITSADEIAEFKLGAPALHESYVNNMFKNYMKDYNNLGKYISLAYMTGITVADAYGEAKQEGASDLEAALLTLGYAAGEYAIINSDLGLWILPELKSEKLGFRLIFKKLTEYTKPENSATFNEKRNWVQKVIDLGKKAAENDYQYIGKSLLKNTAAGALSEGVEEVSEEILYDASKALFNAAAYLSGSDTRLSNFDNVFDRYALSFVGGAIGGSLGSLKKDYRDAVQLKDMDKNEAYQLLVHICKEGKAKEFLKTVDKMTLASPDLSSINYIEDENGEKIFLKGTSTDNLNLAAKQAMHEQVKIILDILDANGGRISDSSLLNILTNADKDFRFTALQNSTFAPSYLLELNTLDTKILQKALEIEGFNNIKSDSLERKEEKKNEQSDIEQKKIKDAKAELKELLEQKEDLISGKRTGEFISKALWEMSDISAAYVKNNFIDWVEDQTKLDYSLIPKKELENLKQKWEEHSLTNRKDDLEVGYDLFMKLNPQASDIIKKYSKEYFKEDNIVKLVSKTLDTQTASNLTSNPDTLEKDLEEQLIVNNDNNIKESSKYKFAQILAKKAHDLNLPESEKYDLILEHLDSDKNELEENLTELLEEMLKSDVLYKAISDDIDNLLYISYTDRINFKLVLNFNSEGGDIFVLERIYDLINKIDNKNYSPILDLIDGWESTVKSPINTKILMNKLNNSMTHSLATGKLSEFNIGKSFEEQIKQALINIKLLKSSILAARTDSVSILNRVGYNTTVNELLGMNLAEIDKNTANVLIQELTGIENKLLLFQRIFYINSGQKLAEHVEVEANKGIILYNKIKKLVFENDNWPPKDWEGVDDLKGKLKDFEIVDTLQQDNGDRTLNLNKEQRIQLRKDNLKIEQAFYDFFAKNLDKLKDSKNLAKLLDSTLFAVELLDKSILNKGTEEMSDRSFIWWLAAHAAMNPTDFYTAYKNGITKDLAPVAGQELSIFTAVAAVLNGEVFANFAKAFNESLELRINQLPDSFFKDPKRIISKELFLDSDAAINFFRTVLITGIAGSGKSTGVFRPVISILRNSEKGKEILENAWYINTTKERAIETAIASGEDPNNKEWLESHCFSREELLEKIMPGVSKIRIVNNDIVKYDLKDLVRNDKTGIYRYNLNINKSIKAPSLMVMDEVTGFSLQDLLAIDDFSDYFGIMNIAAGDFDQSGLLGLCETTEKDSEGNPIMLYAEAFNDNFMGAMKLGSSLRTENELKDSNNKATQAALLDLMDDVLGTLVYLKYFEDESGILGDKVMRPISTDSEKDFAPIKESIDKILSNLMKPDDPDWNNPKSNSKKKLGFIYNNENSKIYKYLEEKNKSGDFKDRIDFKKGSKSLGEELDYYIIDLERPVYNKQSSEEEKIEYQLKTRSFWKDFYTGITRSKKGSLVVIKDTAIQTVKEDSLTEFNLGKAIENFGSSVHEILDKAIPEGNTLGYKQFKGSKPVTKTEETPSRVTVNSKEYSIMNPLNPPLEIGTKFLLGPDAFEVINYLLDADGNNFIWIKGDKDQVIGLDTFNNTILANIKIVITEGLEENEEEVKKDLMKRNIDDIDIDNSDESSFNMLLHSFATEETGFIYEDGRLKPSDCFDERFDSLNGLAKIFGIGVQKDGTLSDYDLQYLLNTLRKIRSSILYNKDKNAIIDQVKEALGIGYNVKARFFFKSQYMPGKNPNDDESSISKWKSGVKKFAKYIKEKVFGIYVNNDSNIEPNQKTLSIMFTRDKEVTNSKGDTKIILEEFLEIPLAVLTNPLTMMHTNIKGMEDIKLLAELVESKLKKPYKGTTVLKNLIQAIDDSPTHINLGENFKKLAKVYLDIMDNNVIFLDDFDTSESLLGKFEGTGPLVTTTPKGLNFYDKDLSYDGDWKDLTMYKKDSGKIISDIIVAPENIFDSTGNKLLIPAGKQLVIVSDAHSELPSTSREALIDLLLKQLNDPKAPKLVKGVFIAPPSSSIAEYFQNMNKVYKNDDTIDTLIGTILSSFNVLEKIMSANILKDKVSKPYIAEYELIKAKVKEFLDKRDSMTSREFIDLLSLDTDLQDFARTVNGSHLTKGKTPKGTNASSWKNYFLDYLRRLVLSYYDMSASKPGNVYFDFDHYDDPQTEALKKIKEKIDTVTQHLESIGMHGIFYHMNIDPEKPAYRGFNVIETNSLLEFKGKSPQINGKIDSLAFKADVLSLLDTIIEKYNDRIEVKDKKGLVHLMLLDTLDYMNNEYDSDTKINKDNEEQKRITKEVKILTKSFAFPKDTSESSLIKDYILEYVKKESIPTTEGFIEFLLDNYITYEDPISNKTLIIPVPTDSEKISDIRYKTGDTEFELDKTSVKIFKNGTYNVNFNPINKEKPPVNDEGNSSSIQDLLLEEVNKSEKGLSIAVSFLGLSLYKLSALFKEQLIVIENYKKPNTKSLLKRIFRDTESFNSIIQNVELSSIEDKEHIKRIIQLMKDLAYELSDVKPCINIHY